MFKEFSFLISCFVIYGLRALNQRNFHSLSETVSNSKHSDQLIVLCNGIMGTRSDLTYISHKLQEKGYHVLESQSNELQYSLLGIAEGARKLKNEILDLKAQNPLLTKIGFIGNSLGGLYARFVLSLLFDKETQTLGGLIPEFFMTIATPHLGVRHHSFFEEYALPQPPLFVKTAVSNVMLQSGRDLFGTDRTPFNQSLIYRLSNEKQFLDPLSSFQRLRLYANVQLDFVVPLGTAGIFPSSAVRTIREKHREQTGIVEVLPPFSSPEETAWNSETTEFISDEYERLDYQKMIGSLNSLPWEKVLVKFDGIWPNAHNKICALSKYNQLIDKLLGYPEGQFVMDHAVDWISST